MFCLEAQLITIDSCFLLCALHTRKFFIVFFTNEQPSKIYSIN